MDMQPATSNGITLADVGIAEKELASMIVEAKDHPARKQFMEDRERYWRLYRGEVLLPEYLKASAKNMGIYTKENIIFRGIETIMSVLSKNNPFYYCVPRDPSKENIEELASSMNSFLRYDYEVTGTTLVLQEWIRASRIVGAAPLKTIWDRTRTDNFKEGQNRVDVISWDDFLPYPYAHELSNCPYIIHKVSKSYLDIVTDPRYGKQAEEALGKRGVRSKFADAWDYISRIIAVTDVSTEGRQPIDVYEFWVKPNANVDIELDDGTTRRTSKYPNGIVITVINGKAVYVRKNPFKHGQFPFDMLYCYRNRDTADKPELRGTIYDVMGEVQQAESPQGDLDMLRLIMVANGRIMTNPPLAYDANLIEAGTIGNLEFRAAGTIATNGPPSDAIYWMQPGQLPPWMFQLYESTKQACLDAMGVTDYMMGTAPRGISHTSGFAVVSAQEAGFGRTNPKINLLDDAIAGLGNKLMSNNQQYRPVGSYYAFTEDAERIHAEWTEDHKTNEFTIQVEHGSTTPVNDLDRAANAMQLYNLLLPMLSIPIEQIPAPALELADWLVRTMKLPGTQSLLQVIQETKEGSLQTQQIMQLLQQYQGTQGQPFTEQPAEV
jgi:hypothetical protein